MLKGLNLPKWELKKGGTKVPLDLTISSYEFQNMKSKEDQFMVLFNGLKKISGQLDVIENKDKESKKTILKISAIPAIAVLIVNTVFLVCHAPDSWVSVLFFKCLHYFLNT